MTRSEYQELVEFLGRQFATVNSRLTRVEVSVEENRHHIQVLAEGITAVDQKLDRFRKETAEEFRASRSEMAGGFEAQSKLIRGLGVRVDRWNGHRA